MKAVARMLVPNVLYRRLVKIRDMLFSIFFKKENSRLAHVEKGAQVLGWRSVRLGIGSIVSEDCWLNVNHRNNPEVQISIADNTFIGRRNFFSSGKRIEIGSYVLTGADCHFVGSQHVFADPFKPYALSGTTADNTIKIGTNCLLGTRVTILGDVNIGHGSIVGAEAFVLKNVPPFSVVVGNPARVVKRYSMTDKAWISSADFTSEMEDLLPSEGSYLAGLKRSEPRLNLPLQAAGSRQGDLP